MFKNHFNKICFSSIRCAIISYLALQTLENAKASFEFSLFLCGGLVQLVISQWCPTPTTFRLEVQLNKIQLGMFPIQAIYVYIITSLLVYLQFRKFLNIWTRYQRPFLFQKKDKLLNFSKNIKRAPNKQTISRVTEFQLLYLQIKPSLRKSWLYLFGSVCLLKIYNVEKKESTYWKSFNERVLIVTKYRITLLQTEYVKIFCRSFEWESL